MKMITQSRKKAKQQFEVLCGKEWLEKELDEVMLEGKKSLDGCMMELGRQLAPFRSKASNGVSRDVDI